MEPRPSQLGIMKSLTPSDQQEVPLIFLFFLKAGWGWDACFTALEFATYLSAVTQAPSLWVSGNRVIPILAHKRIMFPEWSRPAHQRLTPWAYIRPMPFSCPLITPSLRGGEEGLELQTPSPLDGHSHRDECSWEIGLIIHFISIASLQAEPNMKRCWC